MKQTHSVVKILFYILMYSRSGELGVTSNTALKSYDKRLSGL